MALDELSVVISADSTGLQKELGKAEKAVDNFADSADAVKKTKTSFATAETGLRGLAAQAQKTRNTTVKAVRDIGTESKTAAGGVSSFAASFKGAFSGAVILSAVQGLWNGIKGCAQAMYNLNAEYAAFEGSVYRVNEIFGDGAKAIQAFAESQAASLGMAETSAYEYAAVYGNLFRGITQDGEENANATIRMLQASAVIASKTGRTMDDVMERIRSGMLGSTEAIEDLGINVNVASLEMTDAFRRIADGRSWNQLNYYEQQQVRLLGILEQAHTNFGDSVQKGSAYSIGAFTAACKDLKTAAGNLVNAGFQPILQALTEIVRFATAGIKALGTLFGVKVKDNTASNPNTVQNQADAQNNVADAVNKTAKARQRLAKFDEINTLPSKDSGAGGSSGGGGLAGNLGSLGIPELGEMDDTLSKGKKSWEEFAESLGLTEAESNKLKESFDKLKDSIDELKDSDLDTTFLSSFFRTFSDARVDLMTTVVNKITIITNAINGVITMLEGAQKGDQWKIGEGWLEVLKSPFDMLVNLNKEFEIGKLTAIEAIINGIASFFDPNAKPVDLKSWTLEMHDAFLNFDIGEWFQESVRPALEDLPGWFKREWDKGSKNQKLNFEFLSASIETAWDDGWENVRRNWKGIGDWFSREWDKGIEARKLWGDWAKEAWASIRSGFAGIGNWFRDQFSQCWQNATSAFSNVGTWAANVFWTIRNKITGIGDWFKAKFSSAWSGAKSAFSGVSDWASKVFWNIRHQLTGVTSWFKDKFNAAWNAVKNAFSGVGSFFGGIWNTITSKFKGAGDTIGKSMGSAFGDAINKVIGFLQDTINRCIRGINGVIDTINKIPGVNLKKVEGVVLPRVKLAEGGIVDSPTIAMVGEAGKEAVMPLERNTGWIDQLAGRIASTIRSTPAAAGAGGDIVIPVYIGGTKLDEVIVSAQRRHNVRSNGR